VIIHPATPASVTTAADIADSRSAVVATFTHMHATRNSTGGLTTTGSSIPGRA
jgi:hypothetical protein